MGSQSQVTIKLEPGYEADSVHSSTGEMISEVQVFDIMGSKIPASFKTEHPELYVEDVGGEMKSQSLLPDSSIKLEQTCDADGVQSSTREVISEIQDSDKIDSQITTNVKIEQPEVYVDYQGEDMKTHFCPYICPFLHEQVEKKVILLSDVLCEDKSHRFRKVVGMANCCSIQEMAEHNTDSRIHEDITLTHHHEVSLIGNENGYTASQLHENCSSMLESVSSLIDINTKICLNNEKYQLPNVDTAAKHSQISGKFLDYTIGYTSCSDYRIQVGNIPYTSDVSDTSNNEDTYLQKLKTTCVEKNCHECEVCSASFTRGDTLKCHMRIHTGEKPYKCDVCAASFTTASNLKCHMRIHSGEKPYKCDVCAASFTQSGSLMCHMRIHTREKPYKCDVCGASFTEACSLKCHMRIHTGEKPYKCDVCTESFTQSGSLMRHKRTHTGEKSYKCDVCATSFTTASHLKRHMRIHTGEKPYKCDVCDASFTEAGHLKCHMRIHTGEKPYKCDVCGASFSEAGHLKCHMRIHTGEKPYKCDVCDTSFTTASRLKCHMRIHTGERPYKCDVCSASFTERVNLKCHMRIHTGEKPYKCDVCAISVNNAGTLKKHIRTHTGEKPYKCDICAMSFTQVSNLNRHMKTHTGEKPFKCHICIASFTSHSSMKSHLITHTRGETLEV